MIRKQVFFILILTFIFIAMVHSVDDTSRAELEIKAYKPLSAGDLKNDGGFRFVITDALANSDDSSLNVIENGGKINLSDYMQQYIGSASVDTASDASVLFSYRIEAALPKAVFDVSFDITPFENTAADSQDKIDATYSITNQSLNFPDKLSSEKEYKGNHTIHWGIDYNCNHTLTVSLSSELQTALSTTESGSAILKSSIQASRKEDPSREVICDDPDLLETAFSDLWIARGAVTMSIDREDYLNAPNGRYEATVTARLEVN